MFICLKRFNQLNLPDIFIFSLLKLCWYEIHRSQVLYPCCKRGSKRGDFEHFLNIILIIVYPGAHLA